MALREQRVWGNKERQYERVVPRLSVATLAGFLQDAHHVDGVVKGLKQPDWPAAPWQALQLLALRLGRACAAQKPASSV
jgi:DNA polymerase-3 subunit delta